MHCINDDNSDNSHDQPLLTRLGRLFDVTIHLLDSRTRMFRQLNTHTPTCSMRHAIPTARRRHRSMNYMNYLNCLDRPRRNLGLIHAWTRTTRTPPDDLTMTVDNFTRRYLHSTAINKLCDQHNLSSHYTLCNNSDLTFNVSATNRPQLDIYVYQTVLPRHLYSTFHRNNVFESTDPQLVQSLTSLNTSPQPRYLNQHIPKANSGQQAPFYLLISHLILLGG